MIFERPDVRVGEFHCWPGDRLWSEENTVGRGYHVVFPGTPVRITHEGSTPIVTNANHVVFYNDRHVYRRQLLSLAGDHCVFVIPSTPLVREALEEFRSDASADADLRFPFTDGPTDQRTYLLYHEVVRVLRRPAPSDHLAVLEALYLLVRKAIARAFSAQGTRRVRRQATDRLHTDMVEATKELITRRFTDRLSLAELAGAVHSSPYHLAHVFRERTGFTVSRYLTQLRLRTALQRLAEPAPDLARLAIELGFNSHSHFTDRFREAFGIPPSVLRADPRPARLAQLRKMVEAPAAIAP
jgi:AraC family transcriptional regulator